MGEFVQEGRRLEDSEPKRMQRSAERCIAEVQVDNLVIDVLIHSCCVFGRSSEECKCKRNDEYISNVEQ